MSIRIRSWPDEPEQALSRVHDRIDEDLRSHPMVTLAAEAVPFSHRAPAGDRFGPVRLVERDADTAVVFACDTSRWVILVQQEDNSATASVLHGVPNPRVGFDRSFRTSFLQLLALHQTGAPSMAEDLPDVAWLSLSGIAAEGVSRFEMATSVDSDSGDVGADGVVLAVLRGRWKEKPKVVVHLTNGETVAVHHPSLAR
ncbi:hypothetical protein [Antrihabitans spumae]|uniref:Maltokinase N-terminal cap domain-containing protein n=1 Tax=Antrihabitans spumae TaxID=3373370 RepID=A0ABW7KVE8_9NOCA